MNAPVLPLAKPAAPRRYTTADIFYLLAIGVLDRSLRFELIGGEIVAMSPKGRFHEVMREEVAEWLKLDARGFRSLQEHTLALGDDLILEPDFILYDHDRRIADAPLLGPDLRLVIEVADSSIDHDQTTKAKLYAAHGVADYWVIHAVKRTLRVHRAPSAVGYGALTEIGPGDAIAPLCAPVALFRP